MTPRDPEDPRFAPVMLRRTLVADGWHKLQNAPWIAVFPGLAIVYAVMSFNLLGDGLRDALDPKQRGRA